MPLTGDTVKLRVEFRTFEGELADPDTIALTIYDSSKHIVAGPIPITSQHKIDTGIYEYPYIIPNWRAVPLGNINLYYEWIGNPEGLPAIARGVIVCNWQ